jgi:hypothetical protein
VEECLHEELHFGSGDYYIFCSNPLCGRKWAVVDSDGYPAPDLSNEGKQAYLSGECRVKKNG